MKKQLSVLLLALLTLAAQAQTQTQKETINKSAGFAGPGNSKVLSVENIQGFVTVEAYNGDKVVLTAEKKISAKSKAELEKGMHEVQLKMVESGDSVYVYLEAPFIFRKKNRSRNFMVNTDDIDYDYNFDITLKVPAHTNLVVSTVNNGEIAVNNVTGNIRAKNVNGGITLKGAAGKTEATTVNGKVEVTFVKNPPADCKFKTINGDINVYYVPKLNAALAYKTMNGEFFTDVEDVARMPIKVTQNTSNNGANTIYKIDKTQTYQVGKGGVSFQFETLNGNIYLKKK